MVEFVLASAAIFVVMVAWLYVQDLYRRFARHHPELGPYRGEGGCGGSCSCQKGSCSAPSGDQNEVLKVGLTVPAGEIESIRRDRR